MVFYVVVTIAAIAAPSVMWELETAKRKAVTVNSEKPLEAPPLVHQGPSIRPACVARDGTAIFSEWSNLTIGDKNGTKQNFVNNLGEGSFRFCAIADDGTVYVLMHWGDTTWLRSYNLDGKLKWEIGNDEVSSPFAIGKDGAVYLVSSTRAYRHIDLAGISSSIGIEICPADMS